MACCPGDDVANETSILPTDMALADSLCTWLQCMLSKALVHKSPKARGPEVEKSDERVLHHYLRMTIDFKYNVKPT